MTLPTTLSSLRGRFMLLVAGIYLAVGTLAAVLFFQVTGRIIHSLGVSYASQYASRQTAHILGKVDREVVLAQKLADSPILRQWCRDEANPALRPLALAELDSFRKLFADRSYFFVVGSSRNYYFNNAQDEFRGRELQYTIREGDPTTAWYFAAMEHISSFALHVDNSAQLGVTKLWINAVMQDGGRKIALGGSGLDLTEFIKHIVQSPEPGVETILVDGRGFVQGHSDVKLMEANARIRNESQRLTVFKLLDSEADRALLRERLARLSSGSSPVETFELGIGARRRLVAATYMQGIEWTALILVDTAQVIRTGQFVPILALLAAAFLATVLLVSWTLDRLVLSRLARLTDSTREIAAGRYELAIEVDRPDEIGVLTESFKHMTTTIRSYTQDLEQKVAGRTSALQAANQLLDASNRKVMDSIQVARLIQSALLARAADMKALLPDSLVYWRPRDIVGGDFYTLYPDGHGGFLLAVADCTGHGVPGALMTMAAKALLDHAVAELGGDDPAGILRELNRSMRALLSQAGPGGRHGLDIALVMVRPESLTLRFAAARLPLWIQAGGGGVSVVPGDRQSIGYAGSDPAFSFTNRDVAVAPSARVFLLTDGLLDQSFGPKGFGLGQRRLQAALAQWQDVPLSELAVRLDTLVGEERGGAVPQRDDITLLGFRLATGAHRKEEG